ncbi:MAG: MarR family transcriptional regulator [Rhizobiaceae bacterium]|nr:MarR family transcriptional regulator [Rhizobiaceae bacterium]
MATAAESARGRATGTLLDKILPYRINRLAFQMNRLLNADLRKHGLQISHWRILAVLDASTKSTINELSAYAMLEQPTVSRLVARLEQDGLVRRERIDPDGRVVTVSLTRDGKRKYDTVRDLSLRHAGRATHGLSEAERESLRKVLDRMSANLDYSLEEIEAGDA